MIIMIVCKYIAWEQSCKAGIQEFIRPTHIAMLVYGLRTISLNYIVRFYLKHYLECAMLQL